MTAPEPELTQREVLARLFTPEGNFQPGLEDAPPLSSGDVATLFRMSERTIRLWAAQGELPHLRSLGGGRLLYPASRIAVLYAQRYGDSLVLPNSLEHAAPSNDGRRAS